LERVAELKAPTTGACRDYPVTLAPWCGVEGDHPMVAGLHKMCPGERLR
jgi:hypothetical protein